MSDLYLLFYSKSINISLQMNTYLHAVVHNLKTIKVDLIVAEWEKLKYLASTQANFERFKAVERELAKENEKCRNLEIEELQRLEEVIDDCKASKEFDDLVNAE